jgi:hypothetical protein
MKFNKRLNKVLTNDDRFPLLRKLISGLVGLNMELLIFSSGSYIVVVASIFWDCLWSPAIWHWMHSGIYFLVIQFVVSTST